MKRQTGFTLIEALVTVAIAAVLASMAIPSFKTVIDNDRLVSQTNDLVGALTYARSEAIAQNAYTTVCASTDQATCSTSASNWGSGWLVCQQLNGYTNTNCTGGSTNVTTLRVHAALDGGNKAYNTVSLATITFNSAGTIVEKPSVAFYFDVCDLRGDSYGRSVYIYAAGQVRASPTAGKRLDGTAIALC